jgi:hypothetical protein
MNEINEILDYLEYIRQQQRPVSLVNTYQGVSKSLEVEIHKISRTRKEVVVVTNFGQPLSLLPATKMRIFSDLFPLPIQAKVLSVDIHRRRAILKNFSYIQNEQENRKELRVQPKHELTAFIKIGRQKERAGIILNISVEGVSLILKCSDIDLLQYYLPNTSVRVKYSLQDPNQRNPVTLSLPAKVTYINTIIPMEEYRVGLMTYPKEHEKNVLRRFIFDRQTELFRELGQESLSRTDTSIAM